MGEISSDIYLYLPSSDFSSPDNKISEFTVQLSTPLRLSSAIRFEVAMTKIIYPPNVNNVTDGELSFYSYVQKTIILTRIPNGFYPNAPSFVRAFNKILGGDSVFYQLSFDFISKKFKLTCKKSAPFLEFSPNIQSLTGLPHIVSRRGITFSKGAWDVTGGSGQLFVYCDLCDPNTNVGSTTAPVISVFGMGVGQQTELQYEYEPKTLIYTKVNKEIITSVTINIRNKMGKLIDFQSGQTLIVLHLKPSGWV